MQENDTIHPIPLEQLIDDRFINWKNQLSKNCAAPFLLIGLENDSIDGQLSLYFTRETELRHVKTILKGILKKMDSFNKQQTTKLIVKK